MTEAPSRRSGRPTGARQGGLRDYRRRPSPNLARAAKNPAEIRPTGSAGLPYNPRNPSPGTAMIHFEGDEAFSLPPADLYPKLADAGFLARCLPDAEIVAATPDRAAWKQRPRLSFVSGAIE